jgi:hypothetical protein
MADPFAWFTLAGVAAELAKGAIGWAGGKIIEKLFGGGHGKSPAQLQEESIRALTVVFRKLLEEERLKQAMDSLESLIDNMREYHHAPSNVFRLHDATTASIKLVSSLEGLGYPALPSYLVAANLRVCILQDLHAVSKDDGELLNILDTIRESTTSCNAVLAGIETWFNSLIMSPRLYPPHVGLADPWTAQFNGVNFWGATQAEVAAKLKVATGAFRQQTGMDHIQESYQTIKTSWSTLRDVTMERIKLAGIEVPPELRLGV